MSLADRIQKTIRHEMRAVGLVAEPAQPLPCDIDAEAEILSALLAGDVDHRYLAPLDAKHFYAKIHAAIWEAARDVAQSDLVGVRSALIARGWVGALEAELLQLLDAQPWRSRARLRELAERVIELSKRRALIAQLQRLEADLRTDRISEAEASEQLRGVKE